MKKAINQRLFSSHKDLSPINELAVAASVVVVVVAVADSLQEERSATRGYSISMLSTR